MKKIYSFLLLYLLTTLFVQAQILEPIKWKVNIEDNGKENPSIRFTATIENGWHLYGMNLPEGGPISTSFKLVEKKGIEMAGEVASDVSPIKKQDPLFNMEISYFEKSVTFTMPLKRTSDTEFMIKGEIEYMACNDQNCLPPTTEEFSFSNSTATASAKPTEQEKESTSGSSLSLSSGDLWEPVIDQLRDLGKGAVTTTADASLWYIFIMGFIGGLVALLTPCVWPMIPMTVSFFLKRSKNRSRAISDALTYGIAIILIYLLLGLLITVLFGASALNDLSTNAVFNLIFFAMLVLFAVSFFGAFEITLPAKWTNSMDARVDRSTGLISIFFMAFTLSLVSFSCTGPIIGTLLVEAATMGNMTGPAVGMFGFSLALAIPFALFALFPSWLKQMPRSGGWMNSVKVVLGFLELALALKFFSVADLAYGWRLMDREVFLVLWIVIFTLLGMYLLGKLRFAHDEETQHVSIPRFFLALISLSFALYMVPGLWGAPLKAISAFAPPASTQDFNLYKNEVHAAFDDYEIGMTHARTNKKPVLIDFSGYGCVNCRKMEASVWTDPQVKARLENDFVLITLFVDDKTPLPTPISIVENGRERTLKTIGDKWSYLQRHKFGANAQPFYVILDEHGKPMAPAYGFDDSVENFKAFLDKAKK